MKKSFFFLLLFTSMFVCGLYAQSNKPTFPVDSSYQIMRQYEKYKKNYPYIIPVKDQLPKHVAEQRDVVYATLKDTPYGDRDLHMDVFYPDKKGTYPLLMLVHGGGWKAGNKELLVPMAQMVAGNGFVCVSVEYQLGMDAKYPAAVHNLKAAIRFLRANATDYFINPEYIAIGGCSAGGQLAALVGMTNGVEQFEGNMGITDVSSEVQAIIDIDGVINFMAPTSLNNPRSANSPDVVWLGGSFTEKPEIWKEASSIYWANENSVPVLFINSGLPKYHAGQDELVGMLKEWGIYHEVHKFNVNMHTFWHFHPFVDETVRYMTSFMDKTMKH